MRKVGKREEKERVGRKGKEYGARGGSGHLLVSSYCLTVTACLSKSMKIW